MKKLLAEIDSTQDRKDKIAIIEEYTKKEGLNHDIIPAMARAKYFPEIAVQKLIVGATDDKATEAILVLKEHNFMPDRGLLFMLVERSHHNAASAMIRSFKLTLTKPELMSIANKGGAESIITAISLTPDLEVDMIESLMRSAVNDDLQRIFKLINNLNTSEYSEADSILKTKELLINRARFIFSDLVKKAIKNKDHKEFKSLFAELDEYNSKNPTSFVRVESRITKHERYYSGREYELAQSEMLKEIIDSSDSTESEFVNALNILEVHTTNLSSNIIKNLIKHNKLEEINSFYLYNTNKADIEKVLSTSLFSQSKIDFLNKLSLSSKDKISLAKKHGLLLELVDRLSGAMTGRNGKNYGADFICEALSALPLKDFSDVIVKVTKLSSEMLLSIYKSLGTEERKERLEIILSLESAITKKVRGILTSEDKLLLADSEVKTNTTSAKRTWFVEAMSALVKDDINEFRRYITETYPLSKFQADSCSKTNQDRMARSYKKIRQEVWLNLTNEEIKTVTAVGFNLENRLRDQDKINVTRKWSDEDIQKLGGESKLVCVAHTRETEELLLYLAKSKRLMGSNEYDYYFNSFASLIDFAFGFKDKTSVKSRSKAYNHAFDIIKPDSSQLTVEHMKLILEGRTKKEAIEILGKHIEEYDLPEMLSLKCKEGFVFAFKDEFPLDPVLKKELKRSWSIAEGLRSLDKLGFKTVAKSIAKAYISKDYKNELPKLGLDVPDRRKDVQEITDFLGADVSEKRKTTTLRAMKSVVRESKRDVIDEIIEKFKVEEIKAALIKAWSIEGETLNVHYSELNSNGLKELDRLLGHCGLRCLINGIGHTITRESAPYLNGFVGCKNIKFASLPLTFSNNRNYGVTHPEITSDMAEQFIFGTPELRDLIEKQKNNFMSELEGFNLTGEGFELINSMDANQIISELHEEVIIYLLGEKGMLTRKIFIGIQDKKIKFDNKEDQLALVNYAANKLGCKVEELPFLFNDDKIKGVSCLSADDSIMLMAKISIDEFVKGDRPVEIKLLNSQKKLELINYAMKSWNIVGSADPSQLNLEEVDFLDHWTLESFKNLESASLAKIFGFREDDKKSIARVRDVLAVSGPGVIRKAIMMRELWNIVLGQSVKITIEDTLGSDKDESFCDAYSDEIQAMLNAMNSSVISKKFILSSPISAGKLRDWLKTGRDYFKDTFEVIEKIILTNNSIKETTAKAIGISEEDYILIKKGSDSALESLSHIVKNSDFSKIHDVAMKVIKVESKEMLTIENQGQYEKLEKKDITEILGCTLFFPKIYSDTFALGNQNGWCINSPHQSYSNTVREGRAFMVAIAPEGKFKNKDEVMKACEALLYVVFNKRGEVESHQIKFSIHMSKDFSRKLPSGTSGKDTIGHQVAPPEGRYPVQRIIDLVVSLRKELAEEGTKKVAA